QPQGLHHVGTDDAAGGGLAPETDHPSSLAELSLRRHTPKVGAVCGKAARTVLCGGRAMKRTSLPLRNCVVGSGGSWLPCSTIAEHSVEGCDHFSHDGDDDDLGFFVGVGEAIVEGFEGGTVSACAEGGHVEDVTDRHPTTVDAAVSLELAAVEVIGCE